MFRHRIELRHVERNTQSRPIVRPALALTEIDETRSSCDVRGGADRAGKVRNDADLVGVAHRHDLEHLGDATDVRQRRAGEIDVAIFDERVELPALTPFLARRQRDARQQSKLGNLRPVLLFPYGSSTKYGRNGSIRRQISTVSWKSNFWWISIAQFPS